MGVERTIKLMCIKQMSAHWGKILIPGVEYTGVITQRLTDIITDYDNYWKHNTLLANSYEWLMKGYNVNNLHEVIPGYKSHKDIRNLWTKKVNMPFVDVVCTDGQTNTFCLLSDSEVFALGADVNKSDRLHEGRPGFCFTVHQVDDYFDYVQIRRDNFLNILLKDE